MVLRTKQAQFKQNPRPPYRPTCRICKRVLPWYRRIMVIDRIRFCGEHLRQYQQRQQQGVSTTELSKDWSDTVTIWRDRPSELEQEAQRFDFPLFFLKREGQWLLFVHYYGSTLWQEIRSQGLRKFQKQNTFRLTGTKYGPQKRNVFHQILYGDGRLVGGRGPDFLAVHKDTQEIRRFVDVNQDDVEAVLRGKGSYANQEDFAEHWSKPERTARIERFQQQFEDEHRQFRISELVRQATHPIYGPDNTTSDLTLCSIGYEHNNFEVSGISLSFASPRYPQQHSCLHLSTSLVKSDRIYNLPPEIRARRIHSLFQNYRIPPTEHANMGEPEQWEGEILIAGTLFRGEILHWSKLHNVTLATLQSDQILFSAHAYGATREEIQQILENLIIINARTELLEEYQQQYHAAISRLRSEDEQV